MWRKKICKKSKKNYVELFFDNMLDLELLKVTEAATGGVL